MKKNHNILFSSPSTELLNIWNDFINNLYLVNSHIINKFQRKQTLLHRKWILDWSICTEILHEIITNSQHKKASNNLYSKLEQSNLFIMICKQYLLPEKESFTNKFNFDRPSQNLSCIDIAKLCREVNEIKEEKMYVFWDELLTMGASFL